MTDSLRFSVIIPTRDRPAALARCLRAVAQMDYPRDRFEILVVDDGGECTLQETLTPFETILTLTLLTQARAGPAAARNAGAARASGMFLAFTDDDCIPAPNWLSVLESRLDELAGCAVGGETHNALTENVYATASQLLIQYLYAYYNRDAHRARFVASNNFALPRAQFEKLGGFDPAFPLAGAEDRDFCSRWLARGNPIIFAPDARVEHAHALSLQSFLEQHWRYGQGAWHFHRALAARSGTPVRVEPVGFYSGLIFYPFAQHLPRAAFLSLLLILTQAANLSGFFDQALRAKK